LSNLNKFSYIRKLKDNKYRVLSEKGRNMGTFTSKEKAKKRLQQIEYFKKDSNKSQDVDFEKADGKTYSAIMRYLYNNCSREQCQEFMELFKNNFDELLQNKSEKPDELALEKTIKEFKHSLIKEASDTLGTPELVGKYLSNIITFTLASKIGKEKLPQSLLKMKQKIYNLPELEIASKKMPASSAYGQAITFVKHVLFNQNAEYIRQVLNAIVRNL
jgi:arsenate reductase-like glutaredoxin family protein